MVRVHDRHDLTDEQWARLEPVLPCSRGRRGRPWSDHRRVINAVMWRSRTGCPWRDLPSSYGPWKTVYNRHRLWSADGTWARLLDHLRAGSDRDGADEEWVLGTDSTVVRAHHHAAGARAGLPTDVEVSAIGGVLTGG